jgi:hypothetical protein
MPNTPRKVRTKHAYDEDLSLNLNLEDIPMTQVLVFLKRRQPLDPFKTFAATLRDANINYVSVLLCAANPMMQLQAANIPKNLANTIIATARAMVCKAQSTSVCHAVNQVHVKKENQEDVIDLTNDDSE